MLGVYCHRIAMGTSCWREAEPRRGLPVHLSGGGRWAGLSPSGPAGPAVCLAVVLPSSLRSLLGILSGDYVQLLLSIGQV